MMMETSLFLSTVILLIQCFPCVPVKVMTNRHNVEVEELKDAVLSCIFFTEVDQKPRIEWKKKGKDVSFVFYNGKFKGPFEGRATIDGATVTLKSVTQEDAGEYRCEISAPQDTVSLGETNVTLKVLVPPQIPLCEIPSSAVTGSVVQLRCRDQQGIPPATYSWYKDNQLIRAPHHANATYLVNSRTGVLEFKAVTKEDTGQYRCLASNGVGQSKTCEGKHMTIEDVNITAVVATVVVVFLVVLVCGCGGFLLQRNGFCSPGHRGRADSSQNRKRNGAHRSTSDRLSVSRLRNGPPHMASPDSVIKRSNINYIPPPQEPQDFKHTQSFML